MMRKITGLFFVLFAVFIFLPGVTAFAAPGLKVSVTAGIDGKAKYEKGGTVAITVENTGTPFSGDLVIDVMESYGQGMGQAIPLEIGTGETKTVSYTVHNMEGSAGYGGPNSKSIFFYEGGWRKGKEIPHTGAQNIIATMYFDEKIIVTFTNNVDRLVSLKGGVDIGNASNVQIINSAKMGTANFPTEAIGWDPVDYMIIDEYTISDLQSEKQNALLEWVNKGGIIIFGSSDNSEGEAGVFSSYLPLKLKEQITIDPLPLNKWAKTEGFDEKVHGFAAELNEGAISLLSKEENPLIAYKKVGQGLVIQTAFSLGDEPIAKSAGMPSLWGKLFIQADSLTMSPFQYYSNPYNQLLYTIGETNELFPSFKVSAPLIFGIIILYLLLIIPVLYFILKRKDKREYAWWIIPAVALVTSLAIFGYGAKDRVGRAQIQHTAVLNVEEDGILRGYYAESVLSNKSGDFVFKAADQTTMSTTLPSSFFGPGGTMTHKRAILEKSATGSEMHFRNVGYWSVATVFGESRVEDFGEITMDLTVDKGVLTGTIVNEFPFELKDVAIWSGNDFISIKNLSPGETVEINEKLKTSWLRPWSPFQQQYGIGNNNDLLKIRKNSLLSFFSDSMEMTKKPVLIGYTDTQIIPVSLDETKSTLSALTMIVQPVEADIIFQREITVDATMMEMYMAITEDGYETYVIEYPDDEPYHVGFKYSQTWKLPEELNKLKIDWKELTVSNINNQLYKSSVLNIQTGEYEEIDSKEWIVTENIDDYKTEDGVIAIQMEFLVEQYGNVNGFPKLKLSGEVAK